MQATAEKTAEVSTATAEEIAEFRTEVAKYIETGKSDVLTDSEKASLSRVREVQRHYNLPWWKREWENVSSLWKK